MKTKFEKESFFSLRISKKNNIEWQLFFDVVAGGFNFCDGFFHLFNMIFFLSALSLSFHFIRCF